MVVGGHARPCVSGILAWPTALPVHSRPSLRPQAPGMRQLQRQGPPRHGRRTACKLNTSAIFGGLGNLFKGDEGAKTRARYQTRVDQINALEPQMQALSDDELAARTQSLRQRAQSGTTLDDLLAEAFAVRSPPFHRAFLPKQFGACRVDGAVCTSRWTVSNALFCRPLDAPVAKRHVVAPALWNRRLTGCAAWICFHVRHLLAQPQAANEAAKK